ncbi:TPA: hypothetical protein O1G78_001700 [Staphylococcus aureus]|nr:hypothetical protein [Staphylococcus aureus]
MFKSNCTRSDYHGTEEKGSITLSKEAAIIFAIAKFKPFKNRIKNNPQKTNPFLKLHENKKS